MKSMSDHQPEDDLASEGHDERAGSEEEEPYPPWLQHIVEGDYYDKVKVLKEEEDKSQPGYIRCKEIVVPDAADAAENKQEIRKYHLRKHSVVMIVSEPSAAPYIGLVEKIWRDKNATPQDGVKGVYKTQDFMLECYWFYRPSEVPENAWDVQHQPKRREMSGAQFAWSKRSKPQLEKRSERQLLFSSHHTLHDYPDQKGLLSLEGFLQTCEPVHWLGLRDSPPEKYRIHGQRLIKVREPGFVVQGFLWCSSKHEPQLDNRYKRAYSLDKDWGDKDTIDIVDHMMAKYNKRAQRVAARNQEILGKYRQFQAKQRAGLAVSPIASDSGDIEAAQPQQHHQQQQRTQPQPQDQPLLQQSKPAALLEKQQHGQESPALSGEAANKSRKAINGAHQNIPLNTAGRLKSQASGFVNAQEEAGRQQQGSGGGGKIGSGVSRAQGAAGKEARVVKLGAAGSSKMAAAAAAAPSARQGEFGSDDDDD